LEEGYIFDKYLMPYSNTIQCLFCGSDVISTKASVNRKFCNKTCHKHFQTKRPVTSTCKQCRNSFVTTRSKKDFCNQSCAATFNNLKRVYKKRATVARPYREACTFNFKPELHPDKFDINLIRQVGWFNRQTNPNGLVKDHMVSVAFGAANGIDASVINHPANCQLITYSENAAKFSKSSISLEELEERIKNW
jgi:hypothetical protein